MDVGYQRRVISFSPEPCVDRLQIFRFLGSLRRQSHEFATGLDDILGLRYASVGVIGVGGGHALHPNRVVGTHINGTDMHDGRSTALKIE